ncbi:DUF485 domain-containing protein [Candidatus Bipolaricaulota bacterium]
MSSKKEKETEQYVAREFKKSFSLGIFFLVVTLILPILNRFAGDFMATKLFGEFSITYLYSVLLIYIVAWVITFYFVIRTDREEEAH